MLHAVLERDLRVAARVLVVLGALCLTCAFAAYGQVAPSAPAAPGRTAVPSAQAPTDAGLFRLYQSGREIGREVFRWGAVSFENAVTIPLLGMRLESRQVVGATGRLDSMEIRAVSIPADTLIQHVTGVQDGDTFRLVMTRGSGEAQRRALPSRADAYAAPQSVAVYAWLAQRAARRDTTFRVGGAADTAVSVSVAFGGDTAVVTMMTMPIVVRYDAAGRAQAIDVAMQRVHMERWNGRDSLPPLEGLVRPARNYDAPPDAPYTAEQVRVPVRTAAGDTFSLAGTLTLPKTGRPPFPAAVTITGSGLQDRDEDFWPLIPGLRPFRSIAERLAEVGVAVLRCDDRSYGGSSGDATSATSADFAGDVRAAVAWLRARRDIAPGRIALIGHSEGGIIAPMVGADDPRIAALVLMAGTAKTGQRVLEDQVVWPVLSAPGLSDERRAELRAAALRGMQETVGSMRVAWMQFFLSYDPLTAARRVRQPVLILQGALDRQVSAGQADTLAATLRAAGDRDVTVRVFPGLNHLFVASPTDGSPSEYAALRGAVLSRDVLDTMAVWLAARLRVGAAGAAGPR